MEKNGLKMEVHLLSNGRMSLNSFALKAGMIESYVDFVHLREKQLSAREIVMGVKLLQKAGIPLAKIIINDRIDAAQVTRAAGVQLAYHSLEVRLVKQAFTDLRIGKSVHSVEEAMQAVEDGADYVMFGHIFASPSKPDLLPRGTDALKAVVQAVAKMSEIPVIAVGGIQPTNVRQIVQTGARGFAVMSGILEADDPLQTMFSYLKKVCL